ncbi:hypothetical protein [Nonomuraea sp. NPDC049400]|uniref:hypothetical protein n=1 Tax=Nonomuraea sp. NPDC049400 TaxID=3364352 RepID=UPI00379EAD7E
MHAVVIPMHGASGVVVELKQILGAIPENSWAWSILELWGTGVAPQGMTMQSFEDLIASSDNGYPLSWGDLVSCAADLEQVHECLIVAARSPSQLSRRLIEVESDPELFVAIEGMDSTQWYIRVNEYLDGFKTIEERLASLQRLKG